MMMQVLRVSSCPYRNRPLIQRMRALKAELEEEFERRRSEFNYHIERGRVIFKRDIRQRHQKIRQKLSSYIAEARPLVVLTAPVISGMIVLLDVFMAIYQAVCFPVYHIKKVARRDYITFDRTQLSHLNGLEKLNCVCCSHGNGLLAYAVEIAALTEKHLCPIKHAKRMEGRHAHYPDFAEFAETASQAFSVRHRQPCHITLHGARRHRQPALDNWPECKPRQIHCASRVALQFHQPLPGEQPCFRRL